MTLTLTRLEKFLEDSDSKGLWLWLEKNESGTSLLIWYGPFRSFGKKFNPQLF